MSDPKKFWSCGQEKMIFFTASTIVGCCANLKTGGAPHLGNYGPDGVIDIDELANAKRLHLATVRRGETPAACVDCPSLELHDRASDTPYLFNDVNIGHHTACNTDCYYCGTNSNTARIPVAARTAAALLPSLKEMVERGDIDPKAVIRFGGGEPTVLPEFEALVDYFIEVGRRFFINTSGVRYSPAIERMILRGNADDRLVISIDSASPETYEAIKGFDLGDRVWDNIARYAKSGPDILEVKYIVLPDNARETADFVRKCHDIGVRHVSIDLDSRPVIFGIPKALTDEMIRGIAILLYEARQRGISVFHSGSGNALWQEEDGERRTKAALAELSGGRFTMARLAHGFLGVDKLAQDLSAKNAIEWGRCDNVMVASLNSDPGAIHLQEDGNHGVHRIEQIGVAVTANQACTVEVTARPRGCNRILIEFRDLQPGAYTKATFDLEQVQFEAADREAAAIGSVDDEWVRCQLTLVPLSDTAVFNVTLVDQKGGHVYQGRNEAGVDLRPPVVGRVTSSGDSSVDLGTSLSKSEAMFTIEFGVLAEGLPKQLRIVERMPCSLPIISDVHHRARLFLRKANRQASPNSPNAYQVLDGKGQVVSRSWDVRVAHAAVAPFNQNVEVVLEELKQFAHERNVELKTFSKQGDQRVNITIPLGSSTVLQVHNYYSQNEIDIVASSHDERRSWTPDWDLLIVRLRARLSTKSVVEFELPQGSKKNRNKNRVVEWRPEWPDQ